MAKLRIITLEKLMELNENNENVKLVEALGDEAYKDGHIPGAINIPTPADMPVEEMSEKAREKGLKKDDLIVTYCADYQCHASTNAAKKLLEAGYENVMDYKASKKGWTEAGFKLEKS